MSVTIVVPLDASENAEQALPYASALARRQDAPVVLVSVVDIPVEFGAWTAAGATAVGHELDRWIGEREDYLREMAATLEGLTVSTVVKIGSAALEVRRVVQAYEHPVIVMSSHGRTGTRRFFLGSVANKLVHDAHCPVIVVRYQPAAPAMADVAFEKVLVPLDGSEFAEAALERAEHIAGKALTLHLLRVIEPPAIPTGMAYEPGIPLDYGLIGEYVAAVRDESKEYLEAQAGELRARGHSVSWELREGRVAEEILRVATEQQADLIAMATHGRGGLGRLVFGSVAERVLGESCRPLLLVRPGD